MTTGQLTWTWQRDDLLTALAREACTAENIAAQISSDGGVPVKPSAVTSRLIVLGMRIARPGYWTHRDATLRALWAQEPKLKLEDIRTAIGGELTLQSVSRRAMLLGLPARYPNVESRHRGTRRKPDGEVSEKALACRSTIDGGGKLHSGVTTPKPRVVINAEWTQCPFYHPMEIEGGCCPVMVDRRIKPNGARPGPYCGDHEQRILPISRGTIGTVRAYEGHSTYSNGRSGGGRSFG